MGATGAIVFSTELDLAPLQRDWSRAESIGKTGAAKVQSAMANATKAGFSAPGQDRISERIRRGNQMAQDFWTRFERERARRNSAAGFRPAPPGKYDLPEEDDGKGSRMSLRGLGTRFTVVAAIHQLAAVYKEASEAAYKLRVENDKLIAPIGGLTGLDEIRQRITAIAQAEDDAARQRRIDNGSFFGRIVSGGKTALNWAAGFGSPQEQGLQEVSDAEGRRKRGIEAIQLMAERQKEINAAERESLNGSERKAAILKAQITHRERLAQLAREEASLGITNPAARNAENERAQLEIESINRRYPEGPAAKISPPRPSNPAAYFRNPDAYTGRRPETDWATLFPRRRTDAQKLVADMLVARNNPPIPDMFGPVAAGATIGGGLSMGKGPGSVDQIIRGTSDISGKAIVDAITELIKEFKAAWGN